MGNVRELTAEEREMADWLVGLADQRGKARGAGDAIRAAAAREPERLSTAALAVLKEESDADAREWICSQLVESPEFLAQLVHPDRMSRSELVEVCRKWMALDSQLDVRLARLTPGRTADAAGLPADTVVRILDVLDEISTGPRLILLLNHLTRHPNQRIAAKATMLVGRRLRNRDWVSRQLESADGRVRANVVEGLWGVPSKSAHGHLWASLKDKNNRVVGNALIGLHRLGEPGVNEFAKRMLEDIRPPFRWTAAWVMGKIGAVEFVESLERALGDKEANVRTAAERALKAIQEANRKPAPDLGEAKEETPIKRQAGEEPTAEKPPEVVLALQFDGKKLTPLYRPPAG